MIRTDGWYGIHAHTYAQQAIMDFFLNVLIVEDDGKEDLSEAEKVLINTI